MADESIPFTCLGPLSQAQVLVDKLEQAGATVEWTSRPHGGADESAPAGAEVSSGSISGLSHHLVVRIAQDLLGRSPGPLIDVGGEQLGPTSSDL